MSSYRWLGWLATGVLLAGGCAAEPDPRPEGAVDGVEPSSDSTSADVDRANDVDDRSPPAQSPSPPSAPPSEWETEKAWAEARGVVFEAGQVTVVAKRRGSLARSTSYEDEIIVFRPDGTLVRFVATTKPAQMPNPKSSVVPDVDKDGRKDLGIVRPGVYRALGDVKFGLPGHERSAFKIVTEEGNGGLPAWRDLSGDGVFSASERTLSEERGYTIGGIYIHYGFDPAGTIVGGATYAGPWSVGCQNIKYEELDGFIEVVGGAKANFRYAIVDE